MQIERLDVLATITKLRNELLVSIESGEEDTRTLQGRHFELNEVERAFRDLIADRERR